MKKHVLVLMLLAAISVAGIFLWQKYVTSVHRVLSQLPDIDRSKLVKTLPAKPDPYYLKSLSYFNGFKKKYNWHYANGFSIEEQLHFGDYKAAQETIAEGYNRKLYTGYSLEEYVDMNKALLAYYFAAHGDCETAKSYYSINHPVLQAVLTGDMYQGPKHSKPFKRRQYFVLNMASAALLCDSKKAAVKLVENYALGVPSFSLEKPVHDPVLQTRFLTWAYSRLGGDLFAAGYEEQGKAYVDYARQLTQGELWSKLQRSGLNAPIRQNILHAGMYDLLQEYFPEDRGRLDGKITQYLARKDLKAALDMLMNREKDYEVSSLTLMTLFKAIRRESGDKAALAFLRETERKFGPAPYGGLRDINTTIALVKSYALLGERQRANDILEEMSVNFKVVGHDFAMMSAYVVVDHSYERAFKMYKEIIEPLNDSLGATTMGWGYLLGAAKAQGDNEALVKLKQMAEENPKISNRFGEMEFYLDIEDFDRAADYAGLTPVEEGRRGVLAAQERVSQLLAQLRGEDGNFYAKSFRRFRRYQYIYPLSR